MKRILPVKFCLEVTTFISHYVQMKREAEKANMDVEKPLYPTTFRWNVDGIQSVPSYNLLYIPLRSDETMSMRKCNRRLLPTLYPTTFRWNFAFQNSSFWHQITLYPTTFRWNLTVGELREFRMTSLYPTTFRWNHTVCGLYWCI